jgi:colanic acid/amylovoran biosynthesis glycosyltransferase
MLHFLGEDLWARAKQRGCPKDKHHVLIAPAVDVDRFKLIGEKQYEILGSKERPLKILSVGRLEWKKGYEYGLSAVKILKSGGTDCIYKIIGEGNFREAVAFAVHQMGLEDRVEMTGQKGPDEIIEYLSWADVFLHAAVSEGYCNAVIEAQSCGLPVVCSDADGLSENVSNGETGFVVRRRDEKALAEKMGILAGDPALRRQMGASGRKRAKSLFTLTAQLDAFEKMYKGMME